MNEYLIMHRNTVIAKADDEVVTEVINKPLCPAMIFEGAYLERWLRSRSVDTHRSNSRRLYKALRLKNDAGISEIISVGHGITINDNWWIKRKDENINYDTITDYNSEIADISLNGFSDKSVNISGYTQLGTTGSYEKAWRYIDGSWYMFKQGSKTELISEYFAFNFLKSLEKNVAEYRVNRQTLETGLEQEYIVTRDFTENGKYDFEPFFNYFDENEDYDFIISHLENIERGSAVSGLVDDYAEMCFYDALLFNVDRHNLNAGFLRDSSSGRIVCLSPLFDYNISLSAAGTLHFTDAKADLMRYFMSNETCMNIIEPLMPERDEIEYAINRATRECRLAFPNDNFNYSLFENYILSAYDHCSSGIERNNSQNSGIKR